METDIKNVGGDQALHISVEQHVLLQWWTDSEMSYRLPDKLQMQSNPRPMGEEVEM